MAKSRSIWLWILGVLAFAVTLAIVLGFQLAASGVMVVVFGIAVGVAAGIVSALLVLAGTGGFSRFEKEPDDTTTIVMPAAQADTLIRMLSSRQQAAPESFPMVAAERRITGVGGVSIDDEDEHSH